MGLPVRKSKVAAPPPACPLTESLSLLRGAWAPNVIWFLSAEPRRFGELRHDIPRISARVLSARLRELESRGLVTRRVLASSPPSAEYALTPLGRELLPAIQALASVGRKLIAEWGAGVSEAAAAACPETKPAAVNVRRPVVGESAQTSSDPSLTPSNRNVDR